MKEKTEIEQKKLQRVHTTSSLMATKTLASCSPRHLHRKPQPRNFMKIKLHEKDLRPGICYLSPARSPKFNRDYKKSETPSHQPFCDTSTNNSFAFEGNLINKKISQSFQKNILEELDKLNYSQLLNDLSASKNGFHLRNSSTHARKQSTELGFFREQKIISDLQHKNQQLQSAIKQQKLLNENLQKQITVLNTKNYELLKQKETLKLQNLKVEKQYQNEKRRMKNKQELNYYLQEVIIKLNQKIDEMIKKSKLDSSEQLQKCHERIQEMNEQFFRLKKELKYAKIQSDIIKKKFQDASKSQSETQKLKQKNARLQQRIKQLCKAKESQNRRNSYNNSIFQLSPEKQ